MDALTRKDIETLIAMYERNGLTRFANDLRASLPMITFKPVVRFMSHRPVSK